MIHAHDPTPTAKLAACTGRGGARAPTGERWGAARGAGKPGWAGLPLRSSGLSCPARRRYDDAVTSPFPWPIVRVFCLPSLVIALFLAMGCGGARLEEGDLRPAVVATIAAAPASPPADSLGDRVASAGPDLEELRSALLAGTWSEDFESRPGCQDTIEVRQTSNGLKLSGVDCNDNEPYDFREASFDGRNLRVLVVVPATNYKLRYSLELRGRDQLEGEVEVDGHGTSTTYRVRWRRESGP